MLVMATTRMVTPFMRGGGSSPSAGEPQRHGLSAVGLDARTGEQVQARRGRRSGGSTMAGGVAFPGLDARGWDGVAM